MDWALLEFEVHRRVKIKNQLRYHGSGVEYQERLKREVNFRKKDGVTGGESCQPELDAPKKIAVDVWGYWSRLGEGLMKGNKKDSGDFLPSALPREWHIHRK